MNDVVELCGIWLVRADPKDVGVAERWWGARDDDGWAPIALPSAWHDVLGVDYDGIAWFRRDVDVPESWRDVDAGRNILRLAFDAVATDCRVWIDDAEIGRHVGDHVPFHLDATDALDGRDRVQLTLRVDRIAAPKPSHPGGLQHGHITKGFHDVLSLAHGGPWQPMRLERAGLVRAVPNGVSVVGEASGRLLVRADLEPGDEPGTLVVTIDDAGGRTVARGSKVIAPRARRVELPMTVDAVQPWSPADPYLYTASVELLDPQDAVETHVQRLGFRTITQDGRHVLLNDGPVFLRGVLHWGHEPRHGAPAPTPRQVRSELRRLRAMGFNLVCLCMWYPPEHYFEIADELGMLIWQEHPVWQSPMRDADLHEYRRLYEAFMRRDRRHASVAIVSATCEHPSLHPELADWWWRTARRELPGRLLQVQTAFFRWASPEHADLHDEHVYDNSNRWVGYVEDVQEHLARLPDRPFVMGETVLFTSWPDLPALAAACGDTRPWWLPNAFDAMLEREQRWNERYGPNTGDALRHDADRFSLLSRRFQVEQLRRFPRNAGLVMNHLRDVPACQCGFMDDLDRWRFAPVETASWLADRTLLLQTPDHRRGFGVTRDDETLPCKVAVSNFTGEPFEAAVHAAVRWPDAERHAWTSEPVACPPGEVAEADLELPVPAVTRPTLVRVDLATADGLESTYDLWAFPAASDRWPEGVLRFGGLPFEPADAEPDEVERAYSRGYGLPARRFAIQLPDPARLAPTMAAWSDGSSEHARVILTHRLTRAVVDFVERGGRAVVLATKAPGGIGAVYESLYGQVPLIVERGPLAPGDRDWLVDMLVYDLFRAYCRVMPTETLGIADQVDPVIRLVFTHDQPPLRVGDVMWQARLGEGLLIASSLDHTDAPGRYLLHRLVEHAAAEHSSTPTSLDPQIAARWAVP